MTSEADSIDRLRRENAALDQQVKLLVKTEQRLYRSQIALDRELDRSRALARLAQGLSSLDEPEEILARALQLLREGFLVDAGVALLREPGGQALRALGREGIAIAGQSAELERWSPAGTGPAVGSGELVPRELAPPQERAAVTSAIAVPLHLAGQLHALLLGWTTRRRGMFSHRSRPAAAHVPFLELLAGYLERALENAALTRDLRRQRHELARSNAQLKASLAELERTQHQLLQASKMEAIGRLAGGVAHDFNNLLTVILNHAELLARGLSPDSPAHEDVARIITASDRAVAITRQLLTFSRREPWHPEPLDLNQVARSVMGMLERVIGDEVELEMELGRIELVEADHSQIEQVLLNLAVNARDAAAGRGRVRIETRPATAGDLELLHAPGEPDAYAALIVEDNGAGMDAATLAHIFDPFFTTKDPARGTGLGLSVVYGAVQRNQGYLGAESELGRGSRFTVLLPCSSRPKGVEANASAGHASSPPLAVLVAAGEEPVRALAAGALRSAGHLVVEAADARDGRVLGRSTPIDALVTDMALPGGSGLELARALRDECPGLPVVYLSGYPLGLAGENGSSSELGVFIEKPFQAETLRAALSRALGVAAESPGGGTPLRPLPGIRHSSS